MVKHFYRPALICTAVDVLFSSCSGPTLGTTAKTVLTETATLFSIPYANKAELQSLPKRGGIVSWRVARALLMMDFLAEFQKTYSWQNCTLSSHPVVIYGADSLPRYYEFLVLNPEQREVGTLTAPAKAGTIAGGVAYALPYVRAYQAAQTKGPSFKIFNSGYPTRVAVGVLGKSGEQPTSVVDSETDLPVAMAGDADAQALAAVEAQRQNQEFTDQLADFETKIEATSDDQIASAVAATLGPTEGTKAWTEWRDENVYEVPRYTGAIRNTIWGGWCGPSALAWAIRGLQSNYKGSYVPLATEVSTKRIAYDVGNVSRNLPNRLETKDGPYLYNFLGWDSGGIPMKEYNGFPNSLSLAWVKGQSAAIDNGLYYNLSQDMGLFAITDAGINYGQGPTYPWTFTLAALRATDLKYAIDTVVLPSDVVKTLTVGQMPVIVPVENFTHYVVAIGTKTRVNHYRDYWTYMVNLGWFGSYNVSVNIDIPIWWEQNFLYFDNGYTLGKDGHQYRPYWAAQALVGIYFPFDTSANWASRHALDTKTWLTLISATRPSGAP